MNIYAYDDDNGLVVAENKEAAGALILRERMRCYAGPIGVYREDDGCYTWDELYCLAMNTGFMHPWLQAKDAARACLRKYILQQTGEDIEEDECPEEAIERFLQQNGDVRFRMD